jgi:hypothetical protein
MNAKLFRIVLVLSAWAPGLYSEVSISQCATDLVLPSFGVLARTGGMGTSGQINATITIGNNGAVSSVHFEGGKDLYQKEIELALKASKFSPRCSGNAVQIVFTFIMEGDPLENPSVEIRFSGPNHFILRTRPRIPHVLRTREPN